MTEAVPIEKCTTLPQYEVRLEYDVDELAESIRRVGQIQPAKGYREGDSVVVFVGLRRLKAVQKSYEEYGEPKTFLVDIIDPKPSEETIVGLIVEENERRTNLSGVDYVKMYTTLNTNAVEKILSERTGARLRKVATALTETKNQDVLADWHFIEKLTGKQLSIARIEELISLAHDRYELVVGAYAVLAYPIPSPIRDEGRVRAFLHESISLPPELREYLKAHKIEEYAVTEVAPLGPAKVRPSAPRAEQPAPQAPAPEPEQPRRAPEPEASAPQPKAPQPERSTQEHPEMGVRPIEPEESVQEKPEQSARPMSETSIPQPSEAQPEIEEQPVQTAPSEAEPPAPTQPEARAEASMPPEAEYEEEPTIILFMRGETEHDFVCPVCGHKYRIKVI